MFNPFELIIKRCLYTKFPWKDGWTHSRNMSYTIEKAFQNNRMQNLVKPSPFVNHMRENEENKLTSNLLMGAQRKVVWIVEWWGLKVAANVNREGKGKGKLMTLQQNLCSMDLHICKILHPTQFMLCLNILFLLQNIYHFI